MLQMVSLHPPARAGEIWRGALFFRSIQREVTRIIFTRGRDTCRGKRDAPIYGYGYCSVRAFGAGGCNDSRVLVRVVLMVYRSLVWVIGAVLKSLVM